MGMLNEDLRNLNWSAVYNRSNPVSELNKVITSLIKGVFPPKLLNLNLWSRCSSKQCSYPVALCSLYC